MSTVRDIDDYLSSCRGPLGLSQWRVVIDRKRPRAGSMAEIRHTEFRHAFLRLGKSYWEVEPWEQKRTIAHELSHLIVKVWSEVCVGMSEAFGKKQRRAWSYVLEHAEEAAVEHVAELVEHLIPQPIFTCPEDLYED